MAQSRKTYRRERRVPPITSWEGAYAFLRADFPAFVTWEGASYASVTEAHNAANRANLKSDMPWHLEDPLVLFNLTNQKFLVHRLLRRKLLDTRPAVLIAPEDEMDKVSIALMSTRYCLARMDEYTVNRYWEFITR